MLSFYNKNCMDGIAQDIEDESINLVILDPPYFSTGYYESGDRNFKNEYEYIIWYTRLLEIINTKSNHNSSFYLFHNDESIMADILNFVKRSLGWTIRNHIVWNKIQSQNKFSRAIKTFGSNRKYGQTFTEHIWYITKQGDFFDTPFSRIMKSEMTRLGLKQSDISTLEKSRNGNVTGWVHNKIKGSQIPTPSQWGKICKLFDINDRYDDLYDKYRNERYRFNQPKLNWNKRGIEEQKRILSPYGEVWDFPIVLSKIHPNQKPYEMIKHIVETSSNPKDLVLDPFMGSGVSLSVCKDLDRSFVGYESNSKYFNKYDVI